MAELNLQQARFNMIEQQIRPWEVLDQRVLDLLAQMPREEFVPGDYFNLAYSDTGIPIGHGEVMMAPKLEARLLQTLAIQPNETALEIGTGSAYFTALLAHMARHVYSLEIQPEFTRAARKKLQEHKIYNVTLEEGNGAQGWDRHAPYQVIVLTGSLPILPDSFKTQLTIGGRLCAIVGDSPVMQVQLITRVSTQHWRHEALFETDLPPLKHALQPKRFVL